MGARTPCTDDAPMVRTRKRASCWVAASALLLWAGAAVPAGAQEVVSHDPSAPKVSAGGGALAWSTYDAADGAWSLVVGHDGVIERAAVARRAVPFDVDLGEDAAGRLVAAYSRCRTEPRVFAPTGRGCDLYVYDVRARTERRLGGASTAQASEYLPSLAGGRVAFARVYEGRPGALGRRSYLYVRSLAGGPSRRLPGGTMNDDDRTGPTALDLDESRLAFAWDVHGPAAPDYGYGTSEMRIDDLRGPRTIVQLAAHGDLSAESFVTPTLLGGVLYYGRNLLGDGDSPAEHQFRRYAPATGERGAAPAERRLEGTATDGTRVLYVRCVPEADPPTTASGCDVVLRGPVAYADPDAELARAARPAPAAAYAGNAAFSAYDAASGVYRLMLRRRDGSTDALPVAPRGVPFDVDLGPGPDGHLTAAYSRCRTEPRTESLDGMVLPWTGRGCDLYRYDVGARRETLLRGASTEQASEFLPSIWGGEVAFARVYERRPGRRGDLPYLYVRPLAGGASTRLAGGSRGVDGGPGPRAIDHYGRRIAFTWDLRTADGYASELRLDTQGAGHERLAAVASAAGRARLLAPSFEQGILSWASRGGRAPAPASTVERYDLGDGITRTYVTPDPTTTYLDSRNPVPVTGLVAYGRAADGIWSLRSPAWTPRYLP